MLPRFLIPAALLCGCAVAQPPPGASVSPGAPAASAAPAVDDSLYRALGGKPQIDALTTALVGRLKSDPRVGPYFKNINAHYLAGQLADQFCQLSGGPCVLDSAGMKNVHEDLGVHKAEFNRVVEILQQTMEDRGIAFTTQNRLLAKLAPLHRDIISR